MNVTVNYNGINYNLNYNQQSGYFEIELAADKTGIKNLEVTALDLLNLVSLADTKIQVLALIDEKEKYKEKNIAYIFDFRTLKMKDVKKIVSYTIDLDDETNAVSTIKFAQDFAAEEKDYVLLKKQDGVYLGIFEDLTELKQSSDYNARVKHISNIFDEKIFLTNEDLIKNQGIEDFIKKNIEDYFSNSYDEFLNLNYIIVDIKTHTKINKSVETDEENLYNFHTFITNCKQNYNVDMNYEIKEECLVITIEKKIQKAKFIDCTVADIINYKKVYGKQITAKVEVFCEDSGNILKYCLTSDGTIQNFDNVLVEDRVLGKTERIVVQKEEEAYQSAADKFKGNDYNYLVEFSLRRDSLIMEQSDLQMGTPVKLKTKDNMLLNGFITARTEQKDCNLISFKAGKIRRTLRQQLRKGGIL